MTRLTTAWPHLRLDPLVCLDTKGWCFFGGGSPPPPAPLPPVPTVTDPAIEERRLRVKRSEARRSGRRQTILTSGLGVVGDAPVSRPQLTGQLGGN